MKHELTLKFDDSFNPHLYSTQTDSGREFDVEVRDELDKPVDIAGYKLEFYVGNSHQVTKVEAENVGNKFIVRPEPIQFAYAGSNEAQFVLYDPKGLRVGSQIFDLRVEKSIQNGSTMGLNAIVDFEEIKKASELLKNYEKTFEESKVLDLSLKESTEKGAKLNEELKTTTADAESKKKSLNESVSKGKTTKTNLDQSISTGQTLKTGIDNSISTATQTKTNLDQLISTAGTSKTKLDSSVETAKKVKVDLDGSIKTGREVKSALDTTIETGQNTNTAGMQIKQDLDDSISKGNTSKTNLDSSISKANTTKTNLDQSTTNAGNIKTNLDSSISSAKTIKTKLDGSIQSANTVKASVDESVRVGNEVNDRSAGLKSDLEASILKGQSTKSGIDSSIETAKTAKNNLDGSIKTAEAKNSELTATTSAAEKADTDAKATIETLKALLSKSDVTEKGLKEIIESGDLGKYVTEIKLKEELAKIELKRVKVDTLPQTGEAKTLYFVKDPKGKNSNNYLEYLWIDGKFELIGSTQVDLTGYVKTPDLDPYAKTVDVNKKIADVNVAIAGKVAQKDGWGLSENNYSSADKAKVNGIPTNPKYTDTVYKHPVTHPASMITETTDKKFISNELKEKLIGLYKEVLIEKTAYEELKVKDPNTKYYIYEKEA